MIYEHAFLAAVNCTIRAVELDQLGGMFLAHYSLTEQKAFTSLQWRLDVAFEGIRQFMTLKNQTGITFLNSSRTMFKNQFIFIQLMGLLSSCHQMLRNLQENLI